PAAVRADCLPAPPMLEFRWERKRRPLVPRSCIMRDLFAFSIPLVRLFGISLKVHWLFLAFALGAMLRVATQKEFESLLWIEVGIVMAILFVVVLLHELGHCFA